MTDKSGEAWMHSSTYMRLKMEGELWPLGPDKDKYRGRLVRVHDAMPLDAILDQPTTDVIREERLRARAVARVEALRAGRGL